MKPKKVVVILNFYSQTVDFLDYPEDVESIVINEYNGNLEEYLDEKFGYPSSNICYMVSTLDKVTASLEFAFMNGFNK
tara:strand:+ start:589 stop:822 length:234 start_codon:yes stop_codon:yes gene_type:complete